MKRVAIIHEWLTTHAGSERVLEQMLEVFPQADLYSIVDFLKPEERGFIRHKPVRTSFIQDLPFARDRFRHYLPLMPVAVEQFDLSSYDLVLSSSHAVAKGVVTGPNQLHLCMCYSPIRYAWDLQHQYLRESGLETGIKSSLARLLLHHMRNWDYRTANGVDHFIAISNFIAQRIWKVYRRESSVIYPPVDAATFTLRENKEDFFLTASRMVPYKRIDLIVKAFAQMPEKKLVVIGDGPEFDRIRTFGSANVTFLGYQPGAVLRDHMQRAQAFVFAAEEDFGIAPLEAQACGTPVIAFGRGGALETVLGLDHERPTGVFFAEQTQEAITQAISAFEKTKTQISPQNCRDNALRFRPERFRDELTTFVTNAWDHFNKGPHRKH